MLDLSWLLPMLSEVVQKELRLAQSEWTRVTAENANPEVETRMQAEVGALRVVVREGSVRVELPVAYFGKVRARAKTPFGSVWLSKGTDWGTREAPGLVVLEIEVRPSISRNFALSTKSTLLGVRFSAPKGEKLCTTTFVRVCISRDEAASRVHAELEREIRKVSPMLLRVVDARIGEQGHALHAFLTHAVSEMAEPLGAEQLRLSVDAFALGPVGGKDTRLRLDAELGFRASLFTPAPKQSVVPPKGELRGGSNELSYDAVLTFLELGQAWTQKLGQAAVRNVSVVGCEVLGSAQDGAALVLSLSLSRDEQTLKVFAHAELEQQGSALRLSKLAFTSESRAALDAMGVDEAELATLVKKAATASLADAATVQLKRIEQKLGALTLALTPLELKLEGAHYEAVRPVFKALLVRVRAKPRVSLRPLP